MFPMQYLTFISSLKGPKSIAKLYGIHGRIFPLWIPHWSGQLSNWSYQLYDRL